MLEFKHSLLLGSDNSDSIFTNCKYFTKKEEKNLFRSFRLCIIEQERKRFYVTEHYQYKK